MWSWALNALKMRAGRVCVRVSLSVCVCMRVCVGGLGAGGRVGTGTVDKALVYNVMVILGLPFTAAFALSPFSRQRYFKAADRK